MSYSVGVWIQAAQNTDAWRCFVNMVMNEVYFSSERWLSAIF